MLRSGCSAMHGVNPNKMKKEKRQKVTILRLKKSQSNGKLL